MPAEEAKSIFRRVLDGTKRELEVFVRSFSAAWGVLASALLVYALVTSPYPFKDAFDVFLTLTVGFLITLFHAFWPAVVVASIRSVYRAVGLAAFIPIPVALGGIVLSFWAFSGWLEILLQDVLMALVNVGPCGAHTGGAVALFCLVVALMSPAGIWALVKLFLGVSLAIVVGAAPGLMLFVVLVTRAVYQRLREQKPVTELATGAS